MPSSRDGRLDRTLAALADPTRRQILRRLARGQARVTDLATPFPVSFNTVSKHIKVLERAALVTRRKEGREYFLTFRPEPLAEVERWIEKQRAFWGASLAAIDDVLRKEEGESGK